MDERRQPGWAELEAIRVPEWVKGLETASGWRRMLLLLAASPLFPVLYGLDLAGSETLRNARATGRTSRLVRAGEPSRALHCSLDECRRLRSGRRRGWTLRYWFSLSAAGFCAFHGSDAEKDLFVIEAENAPEPVQGRFAAQVAECLSRIHYERGARFTAKRWAEIAVNADPTHPAPKKWHAWLTEHGMASPAP
jgi:hypothetical protein